MKVPKKPNPYSYWDRSQSPPAWNWDHEETLREVRVVRDQKLFMTDWVLLPDSQVSEELKAEVLTYRQTLRDLPSTLTKDNTPNAASVFWPVSPLTGV